MTSTSLEQVIVVCDPVSTGGAIAAELSQRGYLMIKVWTLGCTVDFKDHVPSVVEEMPWIGGVFEEATLEETYADIIAIVGDRKLVGVTAGGESLTGILLATELSETFNLSPHVGKTRCAYCGDFCESVIV